MVDSVIWLPRCCRVCRQPITRGQLCTACHAELPWNLQSCPHCALPVSHPGACARCQRRRLPFDAAFCPLTLQTPIQPWIHALKYHADFAAAQTLGELMSRALTQRRARLPDRLIPVPLHPTRLRWRGYNQAVELARVISQQHGLRMDLHSAQRRRKTDDQIGQKASARRRNLRDAFTVTADLHGQHIALLDDVMTTGATLEALARACRAAGAAQIEAWAIARTP
ncbi:ComF family protein [Sinimarinibacterium sp. NLF-5-8]|uniref:ComF family protein n=1 Tax=Sinimarinibacterium sp. NLF-5-8 TaxID=2698684 RepID=UPI00137C3DBD|nr:ComF family protein [Sinimarinibacterium sp. NLF-5-8]QHS10417.1 ComF family protein [Sinimarinibacterium sp. NLF-5-8]